MTRLAPSGRLNALTAILFLAWMLPGLVGHDPWKPDEAYSFGLVYSALREPGVVPLLAGEPFVEKPPLYYLTAAALAGGLSPPLAVHDAARLATALYLGIAVLFLSLTGRFLFQDAAGRLAVVLLLGSLGLLVRGHQLITDAALFAGFSIALYGLARSSDRPLAGGFWLGTGAGVGFMAKGLLAPGVLGITALALPLVAPTWRRREYLASLAIALAAIAPWLTVWPFALYEASPALFREWFWDNNFGRFLGTSQLGPKAGHGHYLKILPWHTLPLLPLAAWALWSAWRKGHIADALRLPALLFAVTLAVLSLSADARELYAMPLLIPLALLAAAAVSGLPAPAARFWHWTGVGVFTLLIAAAWLAWIAIDLGIPSSAQRSLLELAPAYTPGLKWLPLIVALGYTAAWPLVLRRLEARAPASAAIAWTLGLTIAWALAMTLHLGLIDSAKSYRTLAWSLRSALPASHGCISSRGLGEPQRAMLDYFAGIVTDREEKPRRRAACDLLLVQHSARDPVEERNVIWRGARAGDASERFVLYRVTR